MSRLPFRVPEKLSLEGMQSELSGLIERWWHCGFNTGPLDGQDWAPPMELREEPDCYRVTIELPGVERSAIELKAQTGGVVLSGEKPAPTVPVSPEDPDAQSVQVVQTERRYGSFKRLITVPGPVRLDATSAVLANGVLEVTLPKAEGPTPADVCIDIRSPQEPAQ